MLREIFKIFEALSFDHSIKVLFSSKPRSLSSWIVMNRIVNMGLEFEMIIDGGANVGQFARAAHIFFPKAKILSFEPIPDVVHQLKKNLRDINNIDIFQKCLASKDGISEFYWHKYTQSSSTKHILKKEDSLLKGRSTIKSTIEVETIRLDTLLKDLTVTEPVLLKLDVQGGELDVLKGAGNSLALFDHILFEAVFEQQYQGEALFDDIWRYLMERGFKFNCPLRFLSSPSGKITQMDVLFSRVNGL